MGRRNFITSIGYALRGIWYVFRHEQNFRLQVFLGTIAFAASWLLPLTSSERIVIMLLIVFILVLELVNSAIEKFTDIVKPRLHVQVGIVKDIMAGTVLIASGGALILGTIIFLPHIFELLAG